MSLKGTIGEKLAHMGLLIIYGIFVSIRLARNTYLYAIRGIILGSQTLPTSNNILSRLLRIFVSLKLLQQLCLSQPLRFSLSLKVLSPRLLFPFPGRLDP